MVNVILTVLASILAAGEGASSINLGTYITSESLQPVIDAITSMLPVALPVVFTVVGISFGINFLFKLIRKAK